MAKGGEIYADNCGWRRCAICGLGGCRRFGDEPITRHHIEALLIALEHRGAHASGIGYATMEGEEHHVGWLKDDEPAWKFVNDKENQAWMDEMLAKNPYAVLVHTRAATQGSPRENKNNHPLTVGASVVVHNGMISNDDTLFKTMNLDRAAETDSDIIRAILDKHGITKEGIRQLNRMSGSAAISVVHKDFPNKLLLARSGNPLVYAITDSGLMFWASEKQAIHHAQRQWEEKYGIWVQSNRVDLKWCTMPDNTAYILGENGLEWHDAFKVAYSYTPPRYRVYDSYYEKNKAWDEQNKKIAAEKSYTQKGMNSPTWAACPECEWAGPIPEKLQKKNLWDLVCGSEKKHQLAPTPERVVQFD